MFRRSWQVPGATVTVRRVPGGWMMRVDTGECAAEFPFDGTVRDAVEWLVSQARGPWRDVFASLIRPGMTWDQLLKAMVVLCDDQLEMILEAHYRDVLATKAGRAMLRRLAREADTMDKARQIRRDARR